MHWISSFPTVKTAALYLVPIKSYSKNTHPPSFLEWAVVPNSPKSERYISRGFLLKGTMDDVECIIQRYYLFRQTTAKCHDRLRRS